MNGWHGVTSIVNYVWSSRSIIPATAKTSSPTPPSPTTAPTGRRIRSVEFQCSSTLHVDIRLRIPKMGGSMQKLKNGWGFDSTVTLQSGQPFQLNYNF